MAKTESKCKYTDEQARAICQLVETKFVKLETACNAEGIHYDTFKKYASATGRKPAWRAWWLRAKAKAVIHWLEEADKHANSGNTGSMAGVKHAHNMLMALDDRFRKDGGPGQQGVQVNILVSEGGSAAGAIQVPEIEVIEGEEQVALPEAEAD